MLHDVPQRGLVSLAYSFSRAAHAAPRLYDALAAEAAARLPTQGTFDLTQLSLLAWAFAAAGHPIPSFETRSTACC